MERLIKHAFRCIDNIESSVEDGHYDLWLRTNDHLDKEVGGVFLLPQVWELLVRPFSAIEMSMWPPCDPEVEAQIASLCERSTPSLPIETPWKDGIYWSLDEKSSASDESGAKSPFQASPQTEQRDTDGGLSSIIPAGLIPIVTLTDFVDHRFIFPLEMVNTREVR
jgi:Ubiquitin-like domain